MYLIAVIVIMAAFSIIGMVPLMAKRKDKNEAIFIGMIFSWLGILILFALSSYNGNTIGELINNQITSAVNTVIEDEKLIKLLQLDGLSESALEQRLINIYQLMAVILPSVIIMVGAVISVISYKLVWHIAFKGREGSIDNFYIKNYILSRKTLFMWIVMFAVAYLASKQGAANFAILAVNLEVIIRTMLKVEGVLTIFHIGRVRRKKWILMLLFSVGLWVIPYGDGILIGIGLYSTMYGIRGNGMINRFKTR